MPDDTELRAGHASTENCHAYDADDIQRTRGNNIHILLLHTIQL